MNKILNLIMEMIKLISGNKKEIEVNREELERLEKEMDEVSNAFRNVKKNITKKVTKLPLLKQEWIGTAPQSQALFNFIALKEGKRKKAYKDQAGHWTIGIGSLRLLNGNRVKKGDVVNNSEILEMFFRDIKNHTKFVKLIGKPLKVGQYMALASWEFNLGSGRWMGSNKGKAINFAKDGGWEKVIKEMQKYNKVRSPKTGRLIISKGLKKRRADEARLIIASL